MTENKKKAILFAILAAVFYALNVPFSKQLLCIVPPTFMASFLYLGAGIGVGILYLIRRNKDTGTEQLLMSDLTYTLGMIVLDILAPIFLMLGIRNGSAANASLLGNFEIVTTTGIALLLFREKVSKKLWLAILCITLSSVILSLENSSSFQFSAGSLLVLLATVCWGLENNCTRRISDKNTYQIVMIKGLCCGAGSFVVAAAVHEVLPPFVYIVLAMLLGFVAYGCSIFLYIRAQRDLGAAKTSAYYSIAPFIGTFLSFLLTGETLSLSYLIGLCFMIIGTVFVVSDTLHSAQ